MLWRFGRVLSFGESWERHSESSFGGEKRKSRAGEGSEHAMSEGWEKKAGLKSSSKGRGDLRKMRH